MYPFHVSGKQKNHEISGHDVPENEREKFYPRSVKNGEYAGK